MYTTWFVFTRYGKPGILNKMRIEGPDHPRIFEVLFIMYKDLEIKINFLLTPTLLLIH